MRNKTFYTTAFLSMLFIHILNFPILCVNLSMMICTRYSPYIQYDQCYTSQHLPYAILSCFSFLITLAMQAWLTTFVKQLNPLTDDPRMAISQTPQQIIFLSKLILATLLPFNNRVISYISIFPLMVKLGYQIYTQPFLSHKINKLSVLCDTAVLWNGLNALIYILISEE